MNWLPKNRQKRNQLFLTLGAAVILIGGMLFGMIRPQYARLAGIRRQTADAQTKLKNNQRTILESEALATQQAELSSNLTQAESDMATGDIYAWTIDTMRHFKMHYRVDLPDIGQPSVSDVDILPHFPYKQLKFTVHGTGYYHDIGKFIADFENKFPHMRVMNLEISPIGGDSEKLAFSMDIVALVKSAP